MTASEAGNSRLDQLEEQLRQVRERLAVLERASAPPRSPAADGALGRGEWNRDGLAADQPEPGDAVFTYSGRGWFGKQYVGIVGRARLSDIRDTDPDLVARVFAALGSPARLTVLRALLDGPRTSQQLRAELDDASVGQLYHHLRELLSAGLITQPARSKYAIAKGNLVPLCVQITTAAHLSSRVPRTELLEGDPAVTETAPGDQATA